MPLEELVREVQRKIGRNILLFQQLEYLLKYIIANGQFSGYSSELERAIENKKMAVNKQTMGQLVGQFVESNNPTRNNVSIHPEILKEPYMSFDFEIGTDENTYKTTKETLTGLVSERNNLVHHLLPEFDPNSFSSSKKIEKNLDDQADRVRTEINNVRSVAKSLSEMRNKVADFLKSKEGAKHFFLSFIRQDRLVILLAEICTQVARQDGWTEMNLAGRLVKQHAPDELAALHKGTEHKSLKSLMLKTEMFEFDNEPTSKGGNKALYRLKEGYELTYEE